MRAGAVQGLLGAQAGRAGRHAGRVPHAHGGMLGRRPPIAPELPSHPPATARHAGRGARGRRRRRGRPSIPLNQRFWRGPQTPKPQSLAGETNFLTWRAKPAGNGGNPQMPLISRHLQGMQGFVMCRGAADLR